MDRIGNRPTRTPVADDGLRNAYGISQLSDTSNGGDCGLQSFCRGCNFHDRDIRRITIVSQCYGTITNVNTIAERLKQAREEAGLTQPALAEKAGVSQGTIGNIESGLRKRPRDLISISEALGVSPGWMETGKGEKRPAIQNVRPGPDLRGKVPLISWVRAGEWCDASDPFQPGDAERWLDCPVNHSGGTFALRVRGDSMTAPHGNTRTYPEGCIIFVDPERRVPVNGDRVVACLNGSHEVTFKVYKNEDGRQWLQPLNPSHEPIREAFHVLGTVLGKWEDG